MGDSLATIITIFLAATLMFIFPLASISEMNDNEALAMVQSYTTEFVSQIRTKGLITRDDYDSFVQKLYATGNSYDIEFEVKVADVNPGKKTKNQHIGDKVYYSEFTNAITTALGASGKYYLKQGDFVSVSVKNTNTTISQMIKGVLYSVTGDQSYVISAQAAGTVISTGH